VFFVGGLLGEMIAGQRAEFRQLLARMSAQRLDRDPDSDH
jgi:hypothetical protein